MYMATAIAFNPLGGILSNLIGRRMTFFVLSTIGVLGFVTIALSSNVPALFVGRFMTILCGSGLAANIGVHIAETVHSTMRGSFAVFHYMFISIGMVVVLGLGYFVSDWRTLAWICMVPGCLHLLVILFLHETPYWLVEKNARDQAIKSLQFYRGPNFDIREEFDEIIQMKEANNMEFQTKGGNGSCSSFRRLLSPAFFRPFMMVGIIQLLTNLGVYSILVFNMINIFKDAKSSIEPELAPVFVGVVQVVHSFIKVLKYLSKY
jgi:SP family facilitated glucose transporter-like MFS transporter 8